MMPPPLQAEQESEETYVVPESSDPPDDLRSASKVDNSSR